MKRPMLYWVILFILGELLYRILPISIIGIIAAGMALGIYRIPVAFVKKYNKVLWIGVLFFLFGAVRLGDISRQVSFCNMEEGTQVTVQGSVTEMEVSGKNTYYILKSKKIQGKEIAVKVRLSLKEEENIVLGSKLAATGVVKAFKNATNPGGYDEESYQYGKGVFLFLEDVEPVEVIKPVISVREYLYQIRQSVSKIYEVLFGEKNGSLASAMVLGKKESLDTDIKQLYQRNGIAHLLAISGLHIAMIGGTLYHLLRKWLGSYPVSAGIGILFIVLYGIMTGLSGATLRAVIMLITLIGAEVSGRRYDAVTAVSLALFLMLSANPFQITQAGFLLSFGAVLGIAVVNPLWKKFFPNMPKCLEGITVSISVQFMILPVMLYYFYEVPVYGILLNVVVVPLMSVLLFFLLSCGVIGAFFLKGAVLLAKPAQVIFWLYEALCNMSERLPFHTICTGKPSVLWIFFYYGIVCLMLVFGYRKRYKLLFMTGALYVGMFLMFLLPGNLKICVLDVGQGDGIYIRTPDKKHILMDGGSSSKQKVGTYVLKNGIKYYGGATLDYVFVSHSDSDHYSGVLELFEEETIQIKNLILPDILNPDDAYRQIEQKALEKGCSLHYMKRGDKLTIGNVTFYCLNPLTKEYEDKNQGSLVFLVKYGAFDFLFTGDMDQMIEAEIADKIKEEIEVLKVAHHGSATASSEFFLKKIKAEGACVSVGEKNSYGHPAKEVMERLEQFCEKIYLTKDSGAITIDTDGKKYQIRTFLVE